jgi:hypothetical protein
METLSGCAHVDANVASHPVEHHLSVQSKRPHDVPLRVGKPTLGPSVLVRDQVGPQYPIDL